MDSDSDYEFEMESNSSSEDISVEESSSEESDSENTINNQQNLARIRRINGYDDKDCGAPNGFPPFRPERVPGLQLPDVKTREDIRRFLRPIDFFKLYFTTDLIGYICSYTNKYAQDNGPKKPSVFKNWYDFTEEEFYRLIGLLMYAGLVQAPNITRLWSRKSLYNGLWARAFMTRDRFKAVMSFLKVSDSSTEKKGDKLCKVRTLYMYLNAKCKKLYQPHENVSIDERMVKNKGRYSFRQYIRDKPTKWGMKLWVLADAISGYTYDFEVYVGKSTDNGPFGLAYGVVMKLVKSIARQGYKVYCDNFYTGVQLLKDLWELGVGACGTILRTRRGFPVDISNIKDFEKKTERGGMRWVRDNQLLTVQWRDNKTISIMSNFHSADGYKFAKRRTKVNGEFRELHVRQPNIVRDYNKYMGGVDKSDQLINKYNILRKTNKYWKTLFFHFLDIARVNSYILFQEFRKRNPDIEELKRPVTYGQLEFTEELIRELGNIGLYDDVPVAVKPLTFSRHALQPEYTAKRKSCKLCSQKRGKEVRTYVRCVICDTYLCFNQARNCLQEFHKA